MASPVDTSVKHFYSAMAGAPVLNGVAGSLIAVLDACLVTGWGLKAVDSATVTAGVCRLNFASGKSGAEVDAVILVAGATPAGLSGEQKVTAVSSNWVEFKTALPDGAVAGSVSFKMAPAGWTKAFEGANLAAYQSPNVQSTKMFVRVDDTGSDPTSARLRGYESMSDINTGGGLFPLDSQLNGGGWINKSASANTSAVKWRIAANDRSLYINIVGQSANSPGTETGRTVFIGDFQAYRPGGDPYAFTIGCAPGGSYDQINGTCDHGAVAYQFAPRNYTGMGSSFGLESRGEIGGVTYMSGGDSTFGPFPSGIDGGLRLSRRLMLEGSTPRGVVPGLYTVPQSNVGAYISPLTKMVGANWLAGRNLLAVGCGSSSIAYPSSSLGISFIDITGPWEY
ncbi:hypothetical protein [Comamonas sp. lk]|uniref:hypothetical protein n=1 Tax=Comamonas sp. lk TaxID=2201272 RepID=UPI000EB46564|nr:hypothetical protein [Comamonas sp. lk]